MDVIRAEELTKSYGNKLCVDHLSFALEENCVLGFIGPNGAGKTTTMRMLCGIIPPSSGRAFIRNLDVVEFPVETKSFLGYLPENAPLSGTMTVEGFLKYCGGMRNLHGKALKTALERVTEECDLKSVLHEEAESLSKGFRRRVCLAQAIMHRPAALVLDEPTDGLDPNQKREIRKLIRNLSCSSAVIVSTHILEEIDAVCDRVLTICRGKKVFDGSVPEFRRSAPDKFTVEGVVHLPADFEKSEAERLLKEINTIHILSLEHAPEGVLTVSFRSAADNIAAEKEFIDFSVSRNWHILSLKTKDAALDDVFARLSGAAADEMKS
ncbi:MAG: ATP-binding cassette domain-containing protein [Lentisphaeria bacterium]|nr:ATP-binding cassette domain-containing protein [Lentisphaeria bacterium]